MDSLDASTSPASHHGPWSLHHRAALPGEGSDTSDFDVAVDAAHVANDVLVVSIYKPCNLNPEKDEKEQSRHGLLKGLVEGGGYMEFLTISLVACHGVRGPHPVQRAACESPCH